MISLRYPLFFVLTVLCLKGFSQSPITINFSVNHVTDSNDGNITTIVYNGNSNLTVTCKDNSQNSISFSDSNYNPNAGISVTTSNLSEGVYYFHVTDGTDHVYKYVWVGKYGATTTLSVQPDENYGIDALIKYTDHPENSEAPDENYGNSKDFSGATVTNDGYEVKERSLIKFEYNGLENSTLNSADLEIKGHYIHNHPDDDPAIENELFVCMIEGDDWNENEITWNIQPPFWEEDGESGVISKQGDIDPEPYPDSDFLKNVNMTSQIERHIYGEFSNFGFVIKQKQEFWQRAQKFYSSDHDVATERPKLTLSFTLPDQKQFVKLKKKLDGGFVTLDSDRKLRFIYKEEYLDLNSQLTYRIYSERHEVKMGDASNSGLSPWQKVDINDISLGDNRIVLNIDCCLECGKYFILEVVNEKKEKWLLRFKTEPNDGSNGGAVIVYPMGHPCSTVGL